MVRVRRRFVRIHVVVVRDDHRRHIEASQLVIRNTEYIVVTVHHEELSLPFQCCDEPFDSERLQQWRRRWRQRDQLGEMLGGGNRFDATFGRSAEVPPEVVVAQVSRREGSAAEAPQDQGPGRTRMSESEAKRDSGPRDTKATQGPLSPITSQLISTSAK